MTLRLLTYDRLTPGLERERVALSLAAFHGVLDRRAIEVWRHAPSSFAEYVGVFAVDGGHLVGQTLVLRFPYRTLSGEREVAGIASVTTRADSARRGVARALLEEVHRRERSAGIDLALLWTSPSWYAHHLYESLGYRDVYTPAIAVRAGSNARTSTGNAHLRRATPRAFAEIEALHAEVTANSVGFVPRPPGYLRTAHRAGDDLSGLLVYRRAGRLAGYALVGEGRRHVQCGELVPRPGEAGRLLTALERWAGSRILAIGNTAATALRPELRRRGYVLADRADWRTLMACSLRGSPRPDGLRAELGVDRRSFVCLGLDRF